MTTIQTVLAVAKLPLQRRGRRQSTARLVINELHVQMPARAAYRHARHRRGPGHPATHTTLRLILELEGELIVKCTPVLGYLHCGFEKLGEHLDYNQYVTVTDRMNYVSPMANNIAWHHAVEKLFGIEKLNVPRSTIPAITHVDYSARVQTVDPVRHGRLHRLLKRFEVRTGCPVLINTSFNVRGEPIVCTPEDAYHCFMGTEMDALVLENFVLLKDEQADAAAPDRDRYLAQFALD